MDAVPESFKIKPGEEFACIVFSGFRCDVSTLSDPAEVGSGFWVSKSAPFFLDEIWRTQLGIIVSERIERFSNFVITVKGGSTADRLVERAKHLLWGVCAAAGITQFETGDVVWGNLQEATNYQRGIRVGMGLSKVYQTVGVLPPQVGIRELNQAVKFVQRIERIFEERNQDISNNPFTALYLRPMSGIAAFQLGARQIEPSYRLHQFVRTVEAFMPASVRGANDFVRCAMRFLTPDPRNGDVLKQMYDLRSAIEHHRPFDQRALPGVTRSNDVAMQRTRQAERLAREILYRFLAGSQDLRPYLKDEQSLDNLWSQNIAQAWGAPWGIHAII